LTILLWLYVAFACRLGFLLLLSLLLLSKLRLARLIILLKPLLFYLFFLPNGLLECTFSQDFMIISWDDGQALFRC
jgi:hypothetical protein